MNSMDNTLSALLTPVWHTNRIFRESLLFTPDADTGETLPCRLLCAPREILCLCSADLQTQYLPNRDYRLEDGCIVRLPGSRMPFFSPDEFYLKSPASIPIPSVRRPDRFVRYEPNGMEVLRRQIFITYTHDSPCPIPPPESQLSRLPVTARALREKRPLALLFYGDSFVEGCDASGRSGLPPYLPPFDRLLTAALAQSYAHPSIRRVNTALGGTTSRWGAENAQARLAACRPDLVILRFGMNDSGSGIRPEEFGRNIRAIIETGRREKPEMEFLLLAPETPNPDCSGWTGFQRAYAPELSRLAQTLSGCGFMSMSALFDAAVAVKGYPSLSANLVNHPNDFMIRIYASAAAWALGAPPLPDHSQHTSDERSHAPT